MTKKSDQKKGPRVVADNRRARYHYFIDEIIEAGIILAGTEVKSLREGKASLTDAYAAEKDGAIYLLNAYVPEYGKGNRFNHETKRPRKLLLKRREIGKLLGAVQRKGITLVPLKIYFNDRGFAKVEIAMARGKKLHDKRETEKKRTWNREKARLMREKG